MTPTSPPGARLTIEAAVSMSGSGARRGFPAGTPFPALGLAAGRELACGRPRRNCVVISARLARPARPARPGNAPEISPRTRFVPGERGVLPGRAMRTPRSLVGRAGGAVLAGVEGRV